jgi:hypothetical protein
MYSTNDYAGMAIGPLEFYYGYEVTKCLTHPTKSADYCEDMECNDREWCFAVSKGEHDIWVISESELKKLNPDEALYAPIECLVAGVETYFKENKQTCSLHLIAERIVNN